MFNSLKKTPIYQSLKVSLKDNIQDIEPTITLFGLFGVIVFPLFYFINLYLLAPQSYANLSLRILMSLLCFLLVCKNYWPKVMRPYLPWVWYITLFISMPFFATFMLLKNHCSAAWCLNFVALLILTMLIMNWLIYTILITFGILFGILVYTLITPSPFSFSMDPTPLSFLDFLIACIVSIIMGIILSRNKKLIEQEKNQEMRVIGANQVSLFIAHELRTPLASIELGITGAKMYFPKLLDSYRLARKNKINVPDISPKHFETLLTLFDEL